MRLLVVGAAGGVGRGVVEQGLGHGHEVVAFVHERTFGFEHERLRVVRGDVRDREALAEAANGREAVLAAFGPSSSSGGPTLHSEGAAALVSAMKLQQVRRLVALSAAGVGESRRSVPLAYRLWRIPFLWRGAYEDLQRMEEVVMLSGLDWTIVRPAGLTDGPLTGTYRVRERELPSRGRHVSRADVAAFMLKALSGERFVGKVLAIAD